jgi:hypothetical protein
VEAIVIPEGLLLELDDFTAAGEGVGDSEEAGEEEEKSFVTVNTVGSRANIRTGPGLSFDIVAKGNPGESFEAVGQNEAGDWWQICCFPAGDDDDRTAWVAAAVVTPGGSAQEAAVTGALINGDIESEWAVDWECGSERCAVNECMATVTAQSAGSSSQEWLQIEHEVTWDDTCFSTDSWTFEIDQYTGLERTGDFADNFLYSYWLGEEPGEATDVYNVGDSRFVAVHCSGPYDIEIEEGDGWTTVYEGSTCHDVKTGMIVLLTYTKRWLFTGEFEGESYERAYFGDIETLEQKLVDTNGNLFFMEPEN